VRSQWSCSSRLSVEADPLSTPQNVAAASVAWRVRGLTSGFRCSSGKGNAVGSVPERRQRRDGSGVLPRSLLECDATGIATSPTPRRER
jgi:hypothetical protein